MGRSNSTSKRTRKKAEVLSEVIDYSPPPQERRISSKVVRVQGEIRKRDEKYYQRFPHHVLEWDWVEDRYWRPFRVAPRSLSYEEMRKEMSEVIKDRIALIVKCHYQHDKVTMYQIMYPIGARRLHVDDQIIIRPSGGMPAVGIIQKITDIVEASAGYLAGEFIGWIEFTPAVQAQIDQRRLQIQKDELVASLKKRQENIDLAQQFALLAKHDPEAARELEELKVVMASIARTGDVLETKVIEHQSTDDLKPGPKKARATR